MWTSIGLFIGQLLVKAFGEWMNIQHTKQPAPVLEGEKAGAAQQDAANAQAALKTETAVADAEAQAAATQSALVAEMNKGAF